MEKKKRKSGIGAKKVFAYFFIYAFIGFIIEVIFGVITKGLVESRTSFMHAPLCGVYGLGAMLMVVSLQSCKDNNKKIFFVSFLVGTITEYIISFLAESIFNIKWWDYSDRILNINGRVCLYYSIFWGVLGLLLIKVINPKVDQFINFIKSKLSRKTINVVATVCITLFIMDLVCSWIAIDLFTTRMIVQNDINVKNKEAIIEKYDRIYGNEKLSNFIYTFWGDKRMIKTYPNIKVQDVNGKDVYLDQYLRHIQPYFIKVFDKKLY